ncbi:hypothetical protein DM02DRAFT_663378 [Periconia macrospinosa]|uniref:LACTB2 winged helix domain-containing protein n=1 Tax=Periconia macrospinosa TaxID=97972 RepID=A0A2V1D1Z9_9PLEO|nr:hypothetical protein DM02DRAFT_663378 [Periconia macrospinosa]
MTNLNCLIGYPAHGAMIEDLPRKMRDLLGQREYYERQIFQALECSKTMTVQASSREKGSLSLPEIVQSLYGDVDPEVYKLAVEPSVSGTLGKLAEDRKLGFKMVNVERKWFFRKRGVLK